MANAPQEPVFVPADPLWCGELLARACTRYDLPEVRYRALFAQPGQNPMDVLAVALACDPTTPQGYSCHSVEEVLVKIGDATHRPICALNTCDICWLTNHILEVASTKIVDNVVRLHGRIARREVVLVVAITPVLNVYNVRVCVVNWSTHPNLAAAAVPPAPSSPPGFPRLPQPVATRPRQAGYTGGSRSS